MTVKVTLTSAHCVSFLSMTAMIFRLITCLKIIVVIGVFETVSQRAEVCVTLAWLRILVFVFNY